MNSYKKQLENFFYYIKRSFPSKSFILINSKGKIIKNNKYCGVFCNKKSECDKFFQDSLYNSFFSGQEYITVCLSDFVVFFVPLVISGDIKGGVVGGFCVFPEMKSELRSKIKEKVSTLSTQSFRNFAFEVFDKSLDFPLQDRITLEKKRKNYDRRFYIVEEINRIKLAKEDPTVTLIRRQSELKEKITAGDRKSAMEILNNILGVIFFESGMNFEIIKMKLVEIILVLSRAVIDAGGDSKKILKINYTGIMKLFNSSDIDNLCEIISDILSSLIEEMIKSKGPKAQREDIKNVEKMMMDNPTRLFKVEELAKLCNLSVSRFLHVFKKETGLTFKEYSLKLRVVEAKKLLLNTDMQISEIALDTGFYDQSHFTRYFKSFAGLTPDKFRKQYLLKERI